MFPFDDVIITDLYLIEVCVIMNADLSFKKILGNKHHLRNKHQRTNVDVRPMKRLGKKVLVIFFM